MTESTIRQKTLMTMGGIFGGLAMLMLAAELGAQPAFPGAMGFGAGATGGRGGRVIKVTNLNDGGVGSLQWAVAEPGPRIVVFDVSGVIRGDVRVTHGDLTIAGQTAPGAGITLNGHLFTRYGTTFGNIIIRHLRVRAPAANSEWPAGQHDAMQFSVNRNLILDHVDISHGIDENFDLWGGARDITIQWSAITFPVAGGGHPDGDFHNYGVINGPDGGRISVHHNLFVHNRARTPALSQGPAEVINNVVYNGREGFVHHNPADGQFNIIGNTYRAGPSANLAPFWFDPENNPTSTYFVSDNFVDDPGRFVGRVDNPFDNDPFDAQYDFYCCGTQSTQFEISQPFNFAGVANYVPVTVDATTSAYEAVLDRAGAWPRDELNRWAVEETRQRNGSWGNRRPSSWMLGLTAGAPPLDSDNDGMADAWETQRGLNPNNGSDHATVMPSGYTAIEEYINELADNLVGGGTVGGGNDLFLDGFES